MSERGRERRLLHGYHDGELSGLSRWRLERRLRRDPALRRELAGLARLGDWVRMQEAAPAPDLWDGIERALPAGAPQRAAERADAEPWWRAAWLPPAGALAAAATALAALYLGVGSPEVQGNVVRWMDSGGRNVMVLEDNADVTIIWVLDHTVEGASEGEPPDVV